MIPQSNDVVNILNGYLRINFSHPIRSFANNNETMQHSFFPHGIALKLCKGYASLHKFFYVGNFTENISATRDNIMLHRGELCQRQLMIGEADYGLQAQKPNPQYAQ